MFELNERQREAVATTQGPLLIIAGAGSGKTGVITHRIAYMLGRGIAQNAILALTFTNKAAREMQERVRALTGRKLAGLAVSTFHAFGVRVLRHTIERLGYRENFSIYDERDQEQLLKATVREMRMQPEALDLGRTLALFSAIKTGRRDWDAANGALRPLYGEYGEHLRVYNAVDFDDLIVLPVRIFREHPDVLGEYRARFQYIMVDEFQDTSMAQYDFMKLLADGSRNVCVVGDDDQSIYSWRGANYENILRFETDYPERKEIKLEQNYRSTDTILAAANGVILHNKNRKGKELWTGSSGGRPVEVFYPENEAQEGEFITRMIKTLQSQDGVRLGDVGVLLRTNSLFGNFEEAFLAANIPYRVSGGQSFFQRQEIKDMVAYLRLMANPQDDVSFLRVINTPRRGIGKKTVEHLGAAAKAKNCSLYAALGHLVHAQDSPLGGKTGEELQSFLALIETHRSTAMRPRHIAEALRSLLRETNYWGYLVLEHQKNDKVAQWRYKNVGLFASFIEEWEKDEENMNPGLYNYLNRIGLAGRENEEDSGRGKVNLMTIHAAKGLEFDSVFLPAVEDGIVPHARALEESEENIEEERRLFYVAITRARKKLFITACKKRKVLGSERDMVPSPFLEEIPPDLIVCHNEEADKVAAEFFSAMKKRFGGEQGHGAERSAAPNPRDHES
ncbi:MAG: UvrD-helicase domain-containing protein [Spirochaetia bacterium]|jgi:DNA helicase-2/ATP-dependent DNA helicase PcrA|nr:UvrD-helicase domain-containing protein [Spirochaetia bacterium]